VAGRIDWKYALGLELDDPGFDNSVLSKLRGRLVEHELSRLCFDKVLDRCRELGLVKPGGKQRTDSTHVVAAVRDLTHAELAGEAVRALAKALAAVAPDFLAEAVDLTVWAKLYGPRACDWNWPWAKAGRDALAEQFGRDGRELLTALFAQRSRPWLRELPQVALLCMVLRQNYLVETGKDGSEVMRRAAAHRAGRGAAGPTTAGQPTRPRRPVGREGQGPVLARLQTAPDRDVRGS